MDKKEDKYLTFKDGSYVRDDEGKPIPLQRLDCDIGPPHPVIWNRPPEEDIKALHEIGVQAPDYLYREAGYVKRDGKWVKPDDSPGDQDT